MEGEPSAKKYKRESSNPETESSEDETDAVGEQIVALQCVEEVQLKLEELNKQASDEIIEIEQKYSKKRQPLFCQRSECISKVPKFWLKVFTSHQLLRQLITPEEKECLGYLSRLDVEEFKDIRSGYRFKFTFDENPFFTNRVLIKGFYNDQSTGPTSTATTINWLEGKCLLNNRGRRSRPRITFFEWLSNESNSSANFVSEALKEDIWPNPVPYYLKNGNKRNDESDHGSVVEIDDSDDEDTEGSEIFEHGEDEIEEFAFRYTVDDTLDDEDDDDNMPFRPDLPRGGKRMGDHTFKNSSSGFEEKLNESKKRSVSENDLSSNKDTVVDITESCESINTIPDDTGESKGT